MSPTTQAPPAADIDLLPAELETDVAGTVRAALDKLCTPTRLNAAYDDPAARAGLAGSVNTVVGTDLGMAGLLIDERFGGAGAGPRAAAAVLAEIGRACAPGSFLTSSVVAATALSTLDGDGTADLLSGLAAGEITAALTAPAALDGLLHNVVGLPADVLLVPVPGPKGLALHALPVASVELTALSSLDMTRPVHRVQLSGDPGVVLSDDAGDAVDRAVLVGAGLLASEQVGLAQWCLDQTKEYLLIRRQFGRQIGSFQAVKHRMADLYAQVEGASAAAAYAAGCLAEGNSDVPVAVALAASYCADVAVFAAEEALQLHGGIGMTWEHPLHLRLNRAKADQLILGTPAQHRARLAELVGLPL